MSEGGEENSIGFIWKLIKYIYFSD